MTDSLEFFEQEPQGTSRLYDAIGKASASFPDLPRTAIGQVGKDRKFKYAPFHKVVKCIRIPLAENGVTFIQALHTEEEGRVSLTLIVAGHNAAIKSTLKFKQDSDPKIFGADTTYHKRYQLTSFFGLEGDPDADDFPEDEVERNPVVVEKKAEPKAAVPAKTEIVESKQEPAEKNEDATVSILQSVAKVDKRPVGEKLTDAMKQLVWKMKDFDDFCRQYPEDFPDFAGAARLNPEKQLRLYELLVLHKGVVAF